MGGKAAEELIFGADKVPLPSCIRPCDCSEGRRCAASATAGDLPWLAAGEAAANPPWGKVSEKSAPALGDRCNSRKDHWHTLLDKRSCHTLPLDGQHLATSSPCPPEAPADPAGSLCWMSLQPPPSTGIELTASPWPLLLRFLRWAQSVHSLTLAQVTTGVTSDLRQATRYARHMVAECGMSDALVRFMPPGLLVRLNV